MKTKGHIKDIYPLSPMQEGMLFHTLVEEDPSAYFVQTSYRLKGKLDLLLVEKSLNKLFKRHDALRTVFIYEDLDRPLQVVLKEEKRTVDFHFEDLCPLFPGCREDREKYIEAFIEKDKQRSFDLTKDILMRVSIFQIDETEYKFIWSNHHIIMDGWCIGILSSEFMEIYKSLMEDKPYTLPPVISYGKYIRWLGNQGMEEAKNYWMKYLESYEETATIPKATPLETHKKKYKKERVALTLKKESTTRLNDLIKRNQFTLNTFVRTVWGILLGNYNGRQDVVFGAVVSGRPSELPGINSMVGLFINTIPVRIQFDENMKLTDLLQLVKNTSLESEKYQFSSLAEIQTNSPLKQNLLDHILVVDNYPDKNISYQADRSQEDNAGGQGVGFQLLDIDAFEHTNYDFHIGIIPGGQLTIRLNYNANVYERKGIQRISTHFSHLIDCILKDEKILIGDLIIIPGEEKERLLIDFNNNKRDFPYDQSIDRLIEKQAEMTPGQIAVGGAGLGDFVFITYKELNKKSSQLAQVLRTNGIGRDQLVGVLLERSPLMAESILAVWKSGGAYIPLDTNYPTKRIKEIMKDSRCGVLLTTSANIDTGLEDSNPDTIGTIINLDEVLSTGNPDHSFPDSGQETAMSSLAYVIYTSGSTGKPKGVMVEHLGMMNHMYAKIDDLQLTHKSIIPQNASHTFDISVWQFFAALLLGGQTVIYPDELIMEPQVFISRLVKDRVSILEVVPSYLSILLDMLEERSYVSLVLNYLVVTGEELRPHLVKRWFDRYPQIKVVNAYGPTEASDDITHYIMEKAPLMQRLPIGKPIRNLNIYIVDKHMKLCPIGVKGEICVAGIGVGRGYLNNPALTCKKFKISGALRADLNPFAGAEAHQLHQLHEKTNKKVPGNNIYTSHMSHMSYIYKTGDLGCWLEDGTIAFYGRKDSQVKIRGFRIELGEIEKHLIGQPAIKEAVVIDREDEVGNKYLCAYLVMLTPGNLNIVGIKTILEEHLPDYMVPAHFVQLERLPLTSNGKIDRKALPEPVPGNEEKTIPYITMEMLKQAAVQQNQEKHKPTIIEEETSQAYILSEEEKEQVLLFFNDTHLEFPSGKTLHQSFEQQAGITPDHIALIYKDEKITYRELNKKANGLAWKLKSSGVTVDTAVGLMIDNSPGMIVGILGIMKADGVFLPLDPDYPKERREFMMADTNTRLLITQEKYYGNFTREHQYQIIDIEGVRLPDDDMGNPGHINQWLSMIYIVFTSGTTGKPKGSCIRHRSFMNLVYWYVKEFNLDADDHILLTTSISFDLTLKNIFAPLITGGTLGVTAENYYDPAVTLREIWQNRVTVVNCTPSMLYRLVENEEELKKLSSLRYVFFGGEAMSVTPLKKWIRSDYFNAVLANTYGPSECTGVSATYRLTQPQRFHGKSVPIGSPIYNARLFILNRHYLPVPIGVTGELFIAGEGVGNGYVNDPPLTHEKFVTVPGIGLNERLYRTGDFARWQPGGNIEFLGRKDNQVKIKGLRIELGEIENLLLTHPDIKEAAVVLKENPDGEKQLYACVVAEKSLQEFEMREILVKQLPLYMIPSHFVRLEKMPLTSNGKVNRKILEVMEIKRNKDVSCKAPRDQVENKLGHIWQEVLGIEKKKISVEENFFQLGGHSLKAIMMVSKIHREFNVKIPLAEIFNTPTIKGLAGYIKRTAENKYISIDPVEMKKYYPLSPAQKRLYIFQHMELENTAYNMPQIAALEGELDREALERTFKQLIHRHEILRTSFKNPNDTPVQQVQDEVEFETRYYKVEVKEKPQGKSEGFSPLQVDKMIQDLVKPFDLSKAPLMRVGLIEKGNSRDKHILVVDMHHIISDGVSHSILIQDFMALYKGEELPALRLQYKDYSQWLNREENQETLKKQEEYWLKELEGKLPVLSLPNDFPRPAQLSFEGSHLTFSVDKKETSQLKTLALKEKVSLFMLLMAIYNVMLAKVSGQEEIIVGTPIVNRDHADLMPIIGLFANNLVFRSFPEGKKTFQEFLGEIREQTMRAFKNQDYPFANLVEALSVKRDPGRNPIFDIQFQMENLDTQKKKIPGLKIKGYDHKITTTKIDLMWSAAETNDNLFFTVNYNTNLFKEKTIEKFSLFFKNSISSILQDPARKLSKVEIAPADKKQEISSQYTSDLEEDWNNE
jgi:amino acid adenylation domain-containing protein